MKLFSQLSKINAQGGGGSRVAANALIISGQRLFAALLSLVTTPLVLNALGVEDYGLYAVTVGLVGTLTFINWSLSSTTQRFIAFSIGARDFEKVKRIFASSLLVHGVYAIIILLLIWLLGGFLIERFLTVPVSRLNAAKTIIKLVSVIAFLNIVTIPFTGLFRAHENFLYIAIIGICESILKLGVALSLQFINPDRLIIYSVLLVSISLLIFFINVVLSKRFYPEVNFLLKNIDKGLILEMMSFMGWSLIGAVAIMSRNQGVTVLINLFFGVIANAAYGIAMQVNYAIGMLATGVIGSINPQIIKSAGAGESDKMIYLMRTSSKFAVIAISLVAIPLFFEAPLILKLWLKNVPEGTLIFSRLIILFALIMELSSGVRTVFESIGKVKLYNIWISLILILNLPIAYLFFKLGYRAYTIIITGMFLEAGCLIVRLYLLKKYVDFSIPDFLNDVVFRMAIPICIVAGLLLLMRQLNLGEYNQLVLTLVIMFAIYPFIVYNLALDQKQKAFAKEIISKSIKSIKIFQSRI